MGGPFDVVIIGAGVAGCSAAIRLARAGQRVLLLERQEHPRDKTCGGCLSGAAVAALRELLPNQDLPGIAGTTIDFFIGRYRMHVGGGGATRLVARRDLDFRLAQEAVRAGAALVENSAARLQRCGARWEAAVGDVRLDAGTILLAAGVSSALQLTGIRARKPRRRMIGQSWMQPRTARLPAPGAVEMHWLNGGYIGLNALNEREVLVGFAADAPAGAGSVWEHLRRRNPRSSLWECLPHDAPRRFGAQGAAGFPWLPEQPGSANCLFIGDAAGYVEPFTGEGMGQALFSARCAAEAVLAGGSVLREYGRRMAKGHRAVSRRLAWLGAFLRNPVIQWAAELPPVIPQRWLAKLVARVHVNDRASLKPVAMTESE